LIFSHLGLANAMLLPHLSDSLAGRMEILPLLPISCAECADAPTFKNPGKRLVKAPKAFLPDCGLMAHLAGMTAATLKAASGLPGILVETFVLCELLKHLAFGEHGFTLWHYRTQTGNEADFLLEDRAGRLVGIEAKAAASIGNKDFRGLRHLAESEAGRFSRGIVLYAGQQVVPFGEKLYAVPLSLFWQTAFWA
jgi:predicted AAA+ superfamily ATPase